MDTWSLPHEAIKTDAYRVRDLQNFAKNDTINTNHSMTQYERKETMAFEQRRNLQPSFEDGTGGFAGVDPTSGTVSRADECVNDCLL